MELSSLVFLIEFGLVFGAVFVFGYFQLRSLDKLDKEEAEREAKAKSSKPKRKASK